MIFIYSHDGASEQFIGECAEGRGIRDQLVIATKVILFFNAMVTILEKNAGMVSFSTLSTSRLGMIMLFKKSSTLGTVQKPCTSP